MSFSSTFPTARYCVDCKHYVAGKLVFIKFNYCDVLHMRHTVTGAPKYYRCSDMRTNAGAGGCRCGPEGQLWVSKESVVADDVM